MGVKLYLHLPPDSVTDYHVRAKSKRGLQVAASGELTVTNVPNDVR